MTREEGFMQQAIAAGFKGLQEEKGGPFGCIVVKDDRIIAHGCNCVTSTNDPTAHAEMVAIREACKQLNTFQLEGCEIFASAEPCPMCMGAIYWARPRKVYFAASRQEAADAGFDDSMIYRELCLPLEKRKIEIIRVPLEGAHQLFETWKDNNNRQPY